MAVDDPVGLDPQPSDDLDHRGQRRAAHLQVDERAGEAGETQRAQEPGSVPGQLGDRLQHDRQRPLTQLSEQSLGLALVPPRPATALVVDRRACRPSLADVAPQQPERRLRDEVAVHVVAVGRPDPVAEPHPGVADPHRGRGEHPADLGQRGARVQRDVVGEPERAAALQRPAARHHRIVVAGDEHDLAVGHPLADRAQDRRRDRHRPPRRQLGGELDGVPEQHEPVDAGQRAQQPGQGLGPAQHVVTGPLTEVEVRDDQRAHGGHDRQGDVAAGKPSASLVATERPGRTTGPRALQRCRPAALPPRTGARQTVTSVSKCSATPRAVMRTGAVASSIAISAAELIIVRPSRLSAREPTTSRSTPRALSTTVAP